MDADAEETFFDVDSADYRSLDEVDERLANLIREHFLDRFFEESALSARRRPQARAMLELHDGHGHDTRILRLTFPFMGSTTWYEWDASEGDAVRIADEAGRARGYEVGYDQAHGPTGWEPEFDGEQ